MTSLLITHMRNTLGNFLCIIGCCALIACRASSSLTHRQVLRWSNECTIEGETQLEGGKIKVNLADISLVIEPVGDAADMPDYAADDQTRPWIKGECAEKITKVDIRAKVTGIGANAFKGLKNLDTVTVHADLKKIGASAFAGCTKVTAITAEGVTSVGESAFEGCVGLATVTLAAATEFGNKAFAGCVALATPSFDKLATIGVSTFEGCTGMTSFTGPEVTKMGEKAFFGCDKLATAALAKLTAVSKSGFEGCALLATATLTVAAEFGERAFYGCKALKTPNVDKVTKYGAAALSASGLTTIKFAADVTEIPASVCEGCADLATIQFDASAKVATIGANAFSATKIAAIEIPKSVTAIGDDCFKGCKTLATVTYKGESPIENSIFAECEKLKVTGITLEEVYKSMLFGGFSICEVKQKDGDFHFSVDKGDTKLKLSNAPMPDFKDAKDIPWAKCKSIITEVIFEDQKVTSISAYSFQGHTALEKIEIPAVIKKIPDYTFDGCAVLSNLVLHDEISEFGKYAFRGCAKLSNGFVVPSGVVTLNEGAFQNCVEITKVTFGSVKKASRLLADAASALTTIGNLAFDGCSKLSEVELPEKLTTIGSSSFQGTALKNIVVPASVTSIGDNCFNGCKSLENLEYLGTSEITNNIFGNSSPSVKVPETYPGKGFGGKPLNPDNGLSGGAIAGIVIAVLVVVSVTIVLIVLGVKGKLNCKKGAVVNA